MRYIDKSNRHAGFDEFIAELKPRLKGKEWSILKKKQNKAKTEGNELQLALFQHLWLQQKGLCIYCQQAIPEKKAPYKTPEEIIAQLEHICPQSICKDLIFEQSNIAVSCEGFNLSEPTPTNERRNFCGHRRGNDHNTAHFLNPLIVVDIESYFYYDAAQGKISNNPEKGAISQTSTDYMISILNLNDEDLQKMRAKEYSIWLQEYIEKGEEWIKEQLDDNSTELPPFFSMLKSKFL
jgi:uncharacterized protein (TIGR02646 family)